MTVGVVFRPQQPPEQLREVVRLAEAAGVPELWLWEDCFLEAGVSAAAAGLAWTGTLRIGVGLFPAPLRNPALLAMELATLERLFPGRVVAAVGHGVPGWMDQVGGAVASPMTLLREYVDAVRDLLDGRTVDVSGDHVRLRDVTLEWPPARRPELLVGARGPRTVALAAEASDGVLLDAVADADAVRRARTAVDGWRERPGTLGRGSVVVYTEVDPEGPGLEDRVAERVAVLQDAGADRVVLQASASAPDPRPLINALASAGLVTAG